VTWQPGWPYACLAMGFRSRVLPSLEVFRTDGANCLSHQPKAAAQPIEQVAVRPRFSRRV